MDGTGCDPVTKHVDVRQCRQVLPERDHGKRSDCGALEAAGVLRMQVVAADDYMQGTICYQAIRVHQRAALCRGSPGSCHRSTGSRSV